MPNRKVNRSEAFENKKSSVIKFMTIYTHEQNRTAERSIITILDAACIILVKLELLTKY